MCFFARCLWIMNYNCTALWYSNCFFITCTMRVCTMRVFHMLLWLSEPKRRTQVLVLWHGYPCVLSLMSKLDWTVKIWQVNQGQNFGGGSVSVWVRASSEYEHQVVMEVRWDKNIIIIIYTPALGLPSPCEHRQSSPDALTQDVYPTINNLWYIVREFDR